jgi:hypothetical protein
MNSSGSESKRLDQEVVCLCDVSVGEYRNDSVSDWHDSLSRIADRFDFCVKRNQSFGDDPNIVAQALGDHVEVAPSGNTFLANLVAQGRLYASNFRRQPSVDLMKARIERLHATVEGLHPTVEGLHPTVGISKVCANRNEFVSNFGVHVARGSNNPTIVVRDHLP